MSKLVLQGKILLNSATDTGSNSEWDVEFDFTDNEGVFIGSDIAVGDILVVDTGNWEVGTLTRYIITAIAGATFTTVTATVQYDPTNDNLDPALPLTSAVGVDGVLARPSPNYGLLPVVAPSIQIISDRFSEYLQNYNFNNIVDNITGGGGGTQSDWNATTPDPAAILNKPTLGTAAALDVAAVGNASALQVVLGSDTRLIPQVLTNATPTPTTIGGIAAGTTFSSMPIETVLQNLLYPYQTPAFTTFTISGQTSPIEVGASVAGGPRTFNWGTSNPTNINTNSISVIDVTNGNTVLASSLANTGSTSISISSVTKITATTHQWRVQAVSTAAVTFNSTYTVTWQWRRFHGESTNTSLVATEAQALRVSALSAAFAGTYSFNAGGYKYIAYPTSFGTATSFKDQSTNLDVPFQTVQVISITNANGITANYNIHRTTNVIGSSMNIVVA